MKKIAFIGDSFSAYKHTGQYKNHWSWKLAQQFPQYEYYNYGAGGVGADYCQWCMLDAKRREVDIVFINRTYLSRTSLLNGDCDFEFNYEPISPLYSVLELDKLQHMWYSASNDFYSTMHDKGGPWSAKDEAHMGIALRCKALSSMYQDHNMKWFDNVKNLYNFKHIIPLELIDDGTNDGSNAFAMMAAAHNVHKRDTNALFHAGLTVSLTDTHWSPYGNDWALENYILSEETVNILDMYV
jgi:hypothetical protein|tara:strand:+ start:2784 stop:3506 length:723 start_codon:yes stop_codon:yes gene_type:complete